MNPTNWDLFFEQKQTAYFNTLVYHFEKKIIEAGNPDYFRLMYFTLYGMANGIEANDLFIKKALESFKFHYRMNKNTGVSQFLNQWEELKRNYFMEQSLAISEPKKPPIIERKYKFFLWRILGIPKEISIVHQEPIQLLGKYADLIDTNDKKRIVKFLARYFAFEDFKAYIALLNTETSDEEIEKIEEKSTQKSDRSNTYTGTRQSLAIYYILLGLGWEKTYTDGTNMARLIHLLAGKDIPLNKDGKETLDNSNIYKKVKNLLGKSDIKNVQDLEFILSKFKNISTHKSTGINKIIQLIQNDLDSYTKP